MGKGTTRPRSAARARRAQRARQARLRCATAAREKKWCAPREHSLGRHGGGAGAEAGVCTLFLEFPSILAYFPAHHPQIIAFTSVAPTSARPRPPLEVRARSAASHQALVQSLRRPAPSRFCTVSPVSGALLHRAAPPSPPAPRRTRRCPSRRRRTCARRRPRSSRSRSMSSRRSSWCVRLGSAAAGVRRGSAAAGV